MTHCPKPRLCKAFPLTISIGPSELGTLAGLTQVSSLAIYCPLMEMVMLLFRACPAFEWFRCSHDRWHYRQQGINAPQTCPETNQASDD
ncbi:hypothetical protein NC651_000546 [Populus alba x Populus x berolinensis]|nr:hypothetical protein NC651_000546 [Populus alba x Populus x berolinensis]